MTEYAKVYQQTLKSRLEKLDEKLSGLQIDEKRLREEIYITEQDRRTIQALLGQGETIILEGGVKIPAIYGG